ncbi:MAG: hypothetical protein O3A46_01210 [Candidatus Poribacteria bacterium]|nr:hypothetical protein [Candidatus Poribacteria bacterium]
MMDGGILAISIIFGSLTLIGTLPFILLYKWAKHRSLPKEDVRRELSEMRTDIKAVLSEIRDMQERMADLTLMLDDSTRRSLPPNQDDGD